MKMYIKLDEDTKKWMENALNVSRVTINHALYFDEKRGKSPRAERIRNLALQKGGELRMDASAFETIFCANGIMKQIFSNGVVITVDMPNAKMELHDKNGVLRRSVENCSIPQLYMEQISAVGM